MNDNKRIEMLGYQVGKAGIERVSEHSTLAMQHEKVRIQKTNERSIVRNNVELRLLTQERDRLIASLPPTVAEDNGRAPWWGWYLWIGYLIFTGAAVAFLHIGLRPFNLGPLVWIISIAGAMVVSVALDRLLERPAFQKTMGVICLLATVSGIAGTLLLASVRGDIAMLEVQRAFPTYSEDESLKASNNGEEFYEQAGPKVNLFLIFLALGMELAGALVFHEISQRSGRPNGEAAKTQKRIAEIEQRSLCLVADTVYRQNEPLIVEAEFSRNVHLGMLDTMKSKGLLPLLLAFTLVAPSVSAAHKSLTVAVAMDFSRSVSGQGYDGETSFDRNLDAAARLILTLPPGAQVHVLAISDQSFAKPRVLLSRKIAADRGPLQYFDQITASKQRIVAELRRAVQSRQPQFQQTDIFGAFRLASQLLGSAPERKVLVSMSDMRNSTVEIDLEKSARIDAADTLRCVRDHQLVADLRDVSVYVLGVDGAGRTAAYWDSLKEFWSAYFQRCGAKLLRFSVTRDPPNLCAGP